MPDSNPADDNVMGGLPFPADMISHQRKPRKHKTVVVVPSHPDVDSESDPEITIDILEDGPESSVNVSVACDRELLEVEWEKLVSLLGTLR